MARAESECEEGRSESWVLEPVPDRGMRRVESVQTSVGLVMRENREGTAMVKVTMSRRLHFPLIKCGMS